MTLEQFWNHVQKTDTCWLWPTSIDPQGYGRVNFGGRTRRVHIVAYEAIHGPVPAGKEVDHLCGVRACVNPAHLEAVTHRENLLRGNTVVAKNAAKTHCVNGHPFTGKRNPRGDRVCPPCAAAKERRLRAAKRDAINKRRRELWRARHQRSAAVL
jgi:hypothetical protein